MPATSGQTENSAEHNFGNPDVETQIWFHYQTYPPPGYEYPDEVVRALRTRVDPNFLPLWVITVYRTPTGGDLTFTHIAVAVGDNTLGDPIDPWEASRYTEEQKLRAIDYDLRSIRYGHSREIRIPSRPARLLEILEGPPTKKAQRLPGDYVPLTMAKYHELLELGEIANELARHFKVDSLEDIAILRAKEFLKTAQEKIEKVKNHWKAEAEYRIDNDWNYLQRQIDGLTSQEQSQIIAGRLRKGHTIGHQLPKGIDARTLVNR